MTTKEIKSQNDLRLQSFNAYCIEHPSQRFWQALRNWSAKEYKAEEVLGKKPEIHFIFAGFDQEACEDTFYWD